MFSLTFHFVSVTLFLIGVASLSLQRLLLDCMLLHVHLNLLFTRVCVFFSARTLVQSSFELLRLELNFFIVLSFLCRTCVLQRSGMAKERLSRGTQSEEAEQKLHLLYHFVVTHMGTILPSLESCVFRIFCIITAALLDLLVSSRFAVIHDM